MGAKVNKAVIGAFVLGAVALLVAGVLVLGAGKFFTTKHTYITYFDGSVKGLSVGSPVMFRGVKVGAVTDIGITVDQSTSQLKIPVVFSLEPAKIKGTRAEFQRDPKYVGNAVKQLGLRTRLQALSIVTGQLSVGLEFFPERPYKLLGLNKEYPEIPSVPTPLEELQKTIENLPFKEIVENLNSTLAKVDRLVGSIDGKKTAQAIEAALKDLQTFIRHADAKVDPLVANLSRTSETAEATLAETKETVVAARGHMKDLVASTKSTLDSAQAALKQSEETLQNYSGDSRLVTELDKTLRELTAMSRTLRHLSDYLERHPESLIRGKAAAKGE